MSYTSILDALDCCVECYRDGEIVPGEVSTEDGYFCRSCADLYAKDREQEAAAAQDEKKGAS